MLGLYDLEMMSGGTGRYRINMPQQRTAADAFYDSLFIEYEKAIEEEFGAPPKTSYTQSNVVLTKAEEDAKTRRDNFRRMEERKRGVERGGLGEFTAQLVGGAIESATIAPTLWEKLHPSLDVTGLVEYAEGEYGGEWDELSGIGKAGYGIGTGIGMLAPFGVAGGLVKGGLRGLGNLAKFAGKTPWTTKAAVREVSARAAKLTGKASAKLSDDAIRSSVDAATAAVSKHSIASQIGGKIGTESFEEWAKYDIASRIGASVPKGAVDDLVDLTFDAVTKMTPKNAHAFLSSTVGRLPFIRDKAAGELLASYAYDAMIGATFGLMRFNAHGWADHLEKTGKTGFGTFGAYRKDIDFHKMIDEMGEEAFWIGFLGPVRMIRGGTAGSNIGKGFSVTNRIRKMYLGKPVNRMTPQEARVTLKLIDDVSQGALKKSKIPAIKKAMENPGPKSTHWSQDIHRDEVYDALKGIRRQFLKGAPKLFAEEFAKDMWGSLPRMLMGAMTMNLPTIKDLYNETGGDIGMTLKNLPYTWGETAPEIAANIMVGMFFTKKGRGLRRFDRPPTEGFLQHADAERWIGGQSNNLRRMIAGMEKVGYSTKMIRGLKENQMWEHEQSERYKKGMKDYDFQNSSTYKHLVDILKPFDIDTIDSIRDASDAHPLIVAFRKAMSQEKDVEERGKMHSRYKIARKIMTHLDEHNSKSLNLRPVTPEEAVKLVTELATTKLNGIIPTTESIPKDLRLLAEKTFGRSVKSAIGNQQSYLVRIFEALGYKDAYTVDDKGNIIISRAFDPRAPKGASEDASDIWTNIKRIMKDGYRNNWIKDAKKRIDSSFSPSMEQVEAARKVHNEVTEEMHKMVYGADWTENSQPGTYDPFIISDTVFGNTARVALNQRQSRNSVSLLSGSPELVDSSSDLASIKRTLDDLNNTLRAKDIQIIDWDKVESTPEQERDVSNWLVNVKRIHNLLQPSSHVESADVKAAEVIELKKKMDLLTGDSFTYPEAFQATREAALDHAMTGMGMESTTYPNKLGIISLLKNRSISEDSESLPNHYSVSKFLDAQLKSGKITKEVHKELNQWYRDDIIGSITDSNSTFINLKDVNIDAEKQGAWLDALKRSRQTTIRAEQQNDRRALEGLTENIDGTLTKMFSKFNTFQDVQEVGKELPDADKQLTEILSNGIERINFLKNQIQKAVLERDVDMYREIAQREVAINEALDNLANTEATTGYEAYVLALAKQMNELNSFDNQRISQEQAIELVDRKISESTVKTDRETVREEDIRVTPAQFSMKYNMSVDLMNSVFQFLRDNRNNIGLLRDTIRMDSPGMFARERSLLSDSDRRRLDIYNDLETMRKEMASNPELEYTPEQIANHVLPVLRVLAESNLETRMRMGAIDNTKLAELKNDIRTDSYQLAQTFISTKEVSVLEFKDNTWDLSRRTVSDYSSGFLGLMDMIPGMDIYLMSQSARVDGRHHGFLTNEVIKKIGDSLGSKSIPINSLELESQFIRRGVGEFEDTGSQAALTRELLRQPDFEGEPYHIIHLDENTNIVVRFNKSSMDALSAAYREGSDLYKLFDDGFGLGYGRKENIKIKSVIDHISDNTNDLKTFERGILLARMMNDYSTKVKQYIYDEGRTLDLTNIKKLYKRLVLSQPKSGIYGSQKNIDFALESYRLFAEDGSEVHALALEAMKTSFSKNLTTWVLNDDKHDSVRDDRNPLDAFEILSAKVDYEASEAGGRMLSESQAATIIADAESLKGRGVADGDWYLTKDRFLASLGMFGVREHMLQIETIDGKRQVVGFNNGGIKPTIAFSNVDADGGMVVFIGKTAFKFDPVISEILEARGVEALTFSSANKIFDWVNPLDNGIIQPVNDNATRDNWQRPAPQSPSEMRTRSSDGWIENVIRRTELENARDVDGNELDYLQGVVDLPWESINFKQVAKEHVGSPGPNMFVHFNNRGMEAGKRWLGIDERMDKFSANFHKMILDPYARTQLGRAMVGFSVEAGDNSLARTGMDYILESGGVLVDSWQHPHIERAMISYYLNGGNTSHSPKHYSSMDVMTAEPGNYDMPVRIRDGGVLSNGFPIQTRFGGKGISAFLGDKTFVRSGHQTEFDGNYTDHAQGNSSAFIFRFGRDGRKKDPDGKPTREYEEALIFENQDGEPIVTYRGLQISKEKTGELITRRLADSDDARWEPYDVVESDTQPYTKEFLSDLFEEAVGDASAYADLKSDILLSETSWTNKLVVDHLNSKNDPLWLAAFSVRQPRNAPGDVIITKVQEVLDPRQGNVEKTNVLDALKHHDADFDFDKNTSFMAAPHGIWSELSRLAGTKTWVDDRAVQRYIENEINSNLLLDDNDMMRTAHGELINGALTRGRYVKMHQVVTYLNNMYRKGDSVLTAKTSDGAFVKVSIDKSADTQVNTAGFISKWVKAYIDLYKETQRIQSDPQYTNKKMWDIWFGTEKENGLFKLEIFRHGQQQPPETVRNMSSTDYSSIKEMITARIMRPIATFLTYNRGREETPEGYKNQASLAQMASAYRTLTFSMMKDTQFNGVDSFINITSKGAMFQGLDIEPGLVGMRNYFNHSANPFDFGMRRLHEIEAKKYSDFNLETDGVGKLIKSIETGDVDALIEDARYNKQLQSALHSYVKSEARMVEIVSIERQIQAKQERIEYLKNMYGSNHGESSEITVEESRLNVLKYTRDSLVAGIGIHQDYILGKYNKVMNEIPIPRESDKRKAWGWLNKRGKDVGVLYDVGKGMELQEIILSGRRNLRNIPSNAIIIESPRKYVAADVDNLGAEINFHRFTGTPVYHDGNAIVQRMSDAEWRATEPLAIQLKEKWNDINARFPTMGPAELGARETQKLAAIHELINQSEWTLFAENSGTLGKWALLQRLLVPEMSRTEMEISPEIGIDQSINIRPRLTMAFGGSIVKNVVTYLNAIRTGQGFDKGLISKSEAESMLASYNVVKLAGLLEVNNKYGNLDVMVEGMFADRVDISKHHLFQAQEINQQIYAWANAADANVRDAARTLMKYASGEVMVDPFALYKAARQMETVGIQSNQVFGRWIREEASGDFGQSMRLEFIHSLDAKSERGRHFGDQTTIEEGIDGMIDRIFRCGSK